MRFHRRCGDRVTLLNDNTTAIRNFVEFNHGLILSAKPLKDDVLFEVCVDRKVNVWNGSLEIGVTTLDPDHMELPATATKLRNTAWIMSGSSILKDGVTLVNTYGPELDSLREGECVGVMRTSKGELMFYINGTCLGIAATDMPARLFAVIDLYGQCVQVTTMRPIMDSSLDQIEEDPNNDNTLTPSDVIEVAGLSSESSYPKESHTLYIPMTPEGACSLAVQDRLRFHPRCGILVILSGNNKTAERARPLDDYNNGVVMTHRPLYDNELFEIRIDRLVGKWSGSIEVGVTTHNPATIKFPSTMTNMDSGTIMMSGCKVLLNGHGTCMEYGNFNLDELREGDTVGMMRKSTGLHYFINGVDQGVATENVPAQAWGVIDLYGMTVKVSILDPSECTDSNVNNSPPHLAISSPKLTTRSICRPTIDEDSLLFHSLRDSIVIIINNGKTAYRPNAFEYFNNGIVMTNRTLKTNELFQVRLDLVIPNWSGCIEIGVTQHTANDIQFPFKMSNAKSGTWAMSGEDVIRDGNIVIPQYVRNLNRLVEGDTVGVMRKDMGILHFFVNGVDQGPAAFNIPEHVFGVIDLYGRVAQATIVDMYMPLVIFSPESPHSTESNATLYPEMCFHRVHGRNARLSRNRLTATRATVYSEFNDAVLFSSRPLRECDMFELRIDKMVDCWIGSLEIGVTAIRPDDLEANGGVGAIAGTATDLNWGTYILSGAAMMRDGECVRSGYPLDLDTLTVGSRVGMMWHADRSLHYYLDGMDMGKAWYVPHLNIYAVIDLYGQCTQVTILQNEERAFNYNGCNNSDNSLIGHVERGFFTPPLPYWSFSEYCGDNICLMHDYSIARRLTHDPMSALCFSSVHLAIEEIFEIKILECKYNYAGSFRMGITDVNILNAHVNRNMPPSIACLPHYTAYIDGRYMKYSQHGTRKQHVRTFIPSFEWLRAGDKIGLKKIEDGRVLVYYNSELLDTVFEDVPDKVYVVMEIFGHIYKIQAVSKGNNSNNAQNNQITLPNCDVDIDDYNTKILAPPSWLFFNAENDSTVVLQNTLNDPVPVNNTYNVLDTEVTNNIADIGSNEVCESRINKINLNEISETPVPSTSNGFSKPDQIASMSGIKATIEICKEVELNKTINENGSGYNEANETLVEGALDDSRRKESLPYTFHYIHGKNVKLCSSDTVAMRTSGYKDAITIISQPLRRGHNFRFRVDKVSNEWSGGISIGAVGTLPSETLPQCAMHLDPPVWAVSSDLLHDNGTFRMTSMASGLDSLSERSVLAVHFKSNGELKLAIDGKMVGVIGTVPWNYSHVYPMVDLYGQVYQVSVLLHPYVVVTGTSLDLPIITENLRESPAELDVTDNNDVKSHSAELILSPEPRIKRKMKSYSQENLIEDNFVPIVKPGPSTLPDLPAPQSSLPFDTENCDIERKKSSPNKTALHHSLILSNNPFPNIDNDTNRCVQKSHSTHSFCQATDENVLANEVKEQLRHTFSLSSRVGNPDESEDLLAYERFCDTNIQHNDRYPEASDVDNLDNEIMDALTLETGNLPDLTEEQSSSLDESTRRDDIWSETLSAENLNYLNRILSLDQEVTEGQSLEAEWEASGESCEHLHLVLKYWNFLVLPYPELRHAFSWGQVRCYCYNCSPDSQATLAGWVRIEPIDGVGAVRRAYWHVARATLASAQSVASAERPQVRRPLSLAPQPTVSTSVSDIWFDEEGKPHHTVLAIEIDVEGSEAENDRLLAFLIYLRSHVVYVEDNPPSLDD